MTIRPFESGDAAAVCALWDEVFGYAEARNASALVLERKLSWDARLLVGLAGEAVVGTLMLGYDGHRGWLYRLAVAPPQRRKGMARALVLEGERVLGSLGCAKINLQLHAHNASGARFWEALGYGREVRISMGKDLTGEAPPGADAGC